MHVSKQAALRNDFIPDMYLNCIHGIMEYSSEIRNFCSMKAQEKERNASSHHFKICYISTNCILKYNIQHIGIHR